MKRVEEAVSSGDRLCMQPTRSNAAASESDLQRRANHCRGHTLNFHLDMHTSEAFTRESMAPEIQYLVRSGAVILF